MQRRQSRRGGAGWCSPGGSAPSPPPQDRQDPWIPPAVAFPFPLAFVAEPSYTYLVPFNLPACQLFQPSHYFYGSSLSSCQLLGSGLAERGGTGVAPHPRVPPSMPSFIQPLLHLQIYTFCSFSMLKPFRCIFNLFLPIVLLSLLMFVSFLPALKK